MDATNLRSKKQCATLVALVLFTFSPVYSVFAQQRTLTVETLYDPIQRIDFDGNYPVGLTWLDDNSYVDRRSPQDAFESPKELASTSDTQPPPSVTMSHTTSNAIPVPAGSIRYGPLAELG